MNNVEKVIKRIDECVSLAFISSVMGEYKKHDEYEKEIINLACTLNEKERKELIRHLTEGD